MNTIKKGSTVAIAYSLHIDNSEGELIEEITSAEPMNFVIGDGQALPALEKALAGKSAGDTFSVLIACADAHGEESDDSYVEFPKETFIDDEGELDEDMFEIGEIIYMENEEGDEVPAIVTEVKLNSIVLDFNHPLAGADLYFAGTIISVH
ncbi:MAG: peptidylprolyl isomerase [Flavobacteriales bacterium]